MTFCSRPRCILVIFLWLGASSSSSSTEIRAEEQQQRHGVISTTTLTAPSSSTATLHHLTPNTTTTTTLGQVSRAAVLLETSRITLRETQMLLEFQQGVTKDPSSKLVNWNLTVQPNICNWTGIVCDVGQQYVVTLNLTGNILEGFISPVLGGLQNLEILVLSDNKFTGTVPSSLSALRHLKHLDLSNNDLQGTLPPEITNCTALVYLDLSNNLIVGSFPSDLGNLVNLESLFLNGNDFTAAIPRSLGNCSRLESINLSGNNLVGPIPFELGQLASLDLLVLSQNNLTGMIPTSIATGCLNLTNLDLNSNRLNGEIPLELGQLQMLKVLRLHGNNLTGSIPDTLGFCQDLTDLILGPNPLTGRIPLEVGRLKQLTSLVITGTDITGSIPYTLSNCTNLRRLQLFSNQLNGTIPAGLGKCTNLTVLEVANNHLSGPIPSSLGNLRNLGRLDVRNNQLTGIIPPELGQLKALVELHLSDNSLSGPLITEVGLLKSIEKLNLNNNFLTGKLPLSLSNCATIIELNLSENNFSGPIPGEIISGLRALSYLSLENNQLSGPIPTELGNLEFIIVIDLSVNNLSGDIPVILGKCKGLVLLNVSNNHLTGELPASLAPLPILTQFSVAYNDLVGPIPVNGFFANLTEASFVGNPGLCGRQVQRNCTGPYRRPCSGLKCHRKWVYVVSGAAGFVLALLGLGIFLWMSGERKKGATSTRKELGIYTTQMKVTAEDLWASTEGFSETNILGVGGYSTVYKGVLPGGMPIAVKRLNMDREISNEHDLTHELQILRNLRHKNLLKVYGFVATPELRALVMEFIPNGSLHVQLHKGETCGLSWETRLNIAIGVADAMIHLHHECHEPIIHRDLKPSNILLDPDYNARVADFGIAKNVHFDGNGETTASGLFGTTGYIAPAEYATSNKVSTKGDVYSYGVVILEMLTRKQPTDDTFTPGTWLSLWVLKAYPDRINEILDSSLKNVYRSQEKEIHMLIRIGLLCTRDVPNDRPSMKDVREMLTQLKHPSRLSMSANNYPSMSELADIQAGRYHGPYPLHLSSYDTGSGCNSTGKKSTGKKSRRSSGKQRS
ncbi:hypothetical protein Mapa_008151 [Marchantia paleacea]|nr:hypothetical protein Mapa_008151 [Marchantia paleacea]